MNHYCFATNGFSHYRQHLPDLNPGALSLTASTSPHGSLSHTFVSQQVAGTYIAESVFNYAGIGALGVESAKYHDYNLLMLVVLITGVLVIASSLIAQSINEVIDPRMKVTGVSIWKRKRKKYEVKR